MQLGCRSAGFLQQMDPPRIAFRRQDRTAFGTENGITEKTVGRGLIDVDVFLYKDDMHEILNETDRDDVYHDALRWLDKRIDNLKTT